MQVKCLSLSVQRERGHVFQHLAHGPIGRIRANGSHGKRATTSAQQQGGHQGGKTFGVLFDVMVQQGQQLPRNGSQAVFQRSVPGWFLPERADSRSVANQAALASARPSLRQDT